jgi:ABC-2 type transport system ATP-binding protein
MIHAQSLTKLYGRLPAVRDVSFSVAQGEIVGFLGPNGAGKTTTMRLLTGYMRPTSGTAVIDGFDVQEDPVAVKRRTGYLPENVPLYVEMRTDRFLRYVAAVKELRGKEAQREVDRVVELCGLTEMSRRLIGHLSKGYRQRVGLAQALLGSPPVLILDEPTVGLDPQQIIEIREVIRQLADNHTVLLSTHILPEVAMLCSRALIIHEGRLVAQDALSELTGGAAQRLELVAGGGEHKVREALKGLPGVEVVSVSGASYSLTAPKGRDAAPDVARRLVEAGVTLRALKPVERTLEDVFVTAVGAEGRTAPQETAQ